MTTTYCSDAKIKAVFGTTNADTWADLDNDGNAASKTARYDAWRAAAYERINNTLRQTHYRIPFTGTIPQEIQTLEAILAGLDGMTARGIEDNGPSVAAWQERANKTFADIMSGKIKLDAP